MVFLFYIPLKGKKIRPRRGGSNQIIIYNNNY